MNIALLIRINPHNQSKIVGKKPGGSKHIDSATKKPDVDTITDPYSRNPEVSNCSEDSFSTSINVIGLASCVI